MKTTMRIFPLMLGIMIFFTQCQKDTLSKPDPKPDVIENLDDFLEALPETANFEIQLDMNVTYLITTISEGGILNGVHSSYCINSGISITHGSIYNAFVYSHYSLPDDFSKVDKPGNFPKVNWIINYIDLGEEYTYADVQRAIWELLEYDPVDIATPPLPFNPVKVAEIIAAAEAYEDEDGEFVPVCDQFVVIILDPVQDVQPLIIWIPFICGGE